MPALDTIEGLGDKAAEAVVDAAAKGKFLSKDDFRDRTKVSKTVIDLMDDLDLFGDIPQSNQMALFVFTGLYMMPEGRTINKIAAISLNGRYGSENSQEDIKII